MQRQLKHLQLKHLNQKKLCKIQLIPEISFISEQIIHNVLYNDAASITHSHSNLNEQEKARVDKSNAKYTIQMQTTRINSET